MSAPTACDAAVSLLPALEPILGASLALNLAYLNLHKFAYISVVKQSIGRRLAKLDQNVLNKIGATPWYKQMEALANVETLDESLPWRGKRWIAAPAWWGFAYNLLFYWRIARGLSVLAVFHALSLLILGVGHASGTVAFGKCYFSEGYLWDDYRLAALGLVWPIFVVVIGTVVCSSAAKFVKYQTEKLGEEAVAEARSALGRSQGAVTRASPSLAADLKPEAKPKPSAKKPATKKVPARSVTPSGGRRRRSQPRGKPKPKTSG